MIRTLLVSSLLLAVVLACAPHSPSQTPAPRPECKPALAKWDMGLCTTEWKKDDPKWMCADAKKADTSEFTCNDGTTHVALGTATPTDKKTELKSITCGKDGAWEYTDKAGTKIAAADFEKTLGKDLKFSCAKKLP